MQVFASKKFKKSFAKLPKKTKVKAIERFKTFKANPMEPILNNHSLSGEWMGHRSIDITGDIRAVYKLEAKNIARFVEIGSHSKLYG
jgi:mRNA interferase YafQ